MKILLSILATAGLVASAAALEPAPSRDALGPRSPAITRTIDVRVVEGRVAAIDVNQRWLTLADANGATRRIEWTPTTAFARIGTVGMLASMEAKPESSLTDVQAEIPLDAVVLEQSLASPFPVPAEWVSARAVASPAGLLVAVSLTVGEPPTAVNDTAPASGGLVLRR